MSSILGKTTYASKCLSTLTPEDAQKLQTLIDNPGEPEILYLYGTDRTLKDFSDNLEEGDSGVYYVQLMIDEYSRRYLNGFLIIPRTIEASFAMELTSGFFSFADLSSHLIEIKILCFPDGTIEYEDIYENLTAEEFRRTLYDVAISMGAAPLTQQVYETYNTAGEVNATTTITGEGINIEGANTHLKIINSSRNEFLIDSNDGSELYITTKINDNSYSLQFPHKSGTIALIDDIGANVNVPGEQATVVFIKGFRENLNSRVLSAYEENLTGINLGGASFNIYLVCQITKGGEKLTEEQAKAYMKYMTGSDYLPKYNYDYPQNTLFIKKDDGSYWKPQYDDNNGMVLWYVETPYAKVYEINSLSTFEEMETYYKYKIGNILRYISYSSSGQVLVSLLINRIEAGNAENNVPAIIHASGSDIVNDNAIVYNLEWVEGQAPTLTTKSTGTKLYFHRITFNQSTSNNALTFTTNSSTKIIDENNITSSIGNIRQIITDDFASQKMVGGAKIYNEDGLDETLLVLGIRSAGATSISFAVGYTSLTTESFNVTEIDETVTPL